jgi:hypothetical protein
MTCCWCWQAGLGQVSVARRAVLFMVSFPLSLSTEQSQRFGPLCDDLSPLRTRSQGHLKLREFPHPNTGFLKGKDEKVCVFTNPRSDDLRIRRKTDAPQITSNPQKQWRSFHSNAASGVPNAVVMVATMDVDIIRSPEDLRTAQTALVGRAHRAWDSDWLVLLLCKARLPGAKTGACAVTQPVCAPLRRFSPPCVV